MSPVAAPRIHLCIIQPLGAIHALGFVDQARYYRHQFSRLGAVVTLGKNRLRHDALNFVFGAHLGFDAQLTERYRCVIVNLEQLGAGGAALEPAYLKLLREQAVVDYDAGNQAAYAALGRSAPPPLLPLQHAPYLATSQTLPLQERPIDLLFFGVLNERRRDWLARVEAAGVQVAQFDAPLYGPERDDFIRQAKAVLNVHFYESSRFEQCRVAHCLSLGTPVIAERAAATRADAVFAETVHWITADSCADFFSQQFGSPAFFARSQAQLQAFAASDPLPQYRAALDSLLQALPERATAVWQPTLIHLGSGKDYKPGWLNLDVLAQAQPDLLLDLARPLSLPLTLHSELAGPVELVAGQCELIYANNVLEHVPDLGQLMGNLLQLLAEGGELAVEVPYERALTAWQDPSHVRAMNENSWRYYTDWFWYLGWFEHRFELIEQVWLDIDLAPCLQSEAAFMQVVLRKVPTSPRERTKARAMQADFGGLPEDL